MISQLKGTVESINSNKVTVDVGGVGYEVHCSAGCIASLEVGQNTKITIYTHVREDAITLYGFEDSLEKQVFLLITSVQGVGPKSGAEIISSIDKRDLLRAIGSEDSTQLQRIKGVGKKLSERIIVELKDKVADFVQGRIEKSYDVAGRLPSSPSSNLEDATAALEALGFTRKDAERAVQQATAQTDAAVLESGQIVRDALRFV